MGGMTRLKGMGMFMAATWLGPALIMPSWSWVWKYMFEGRPAKQGRWLIPHCIQVSLLPAPNRLFCLQFLGCPTAEQYVTDSHLQSPFQSPGAGAQEIAFSLRDSEKHCYSDPRK